MNDNQTKSSGVKGGWIFPVFLAVLAFHVLAILGIAMFNGWKFGGTGPAQNMGLTQQPPELAKNTLAETAVVPASKTVPVIHDEKLSSHELDVLEKEILSQTDNEDVGVPIPESSELALAGTQKEELGNGSASTVADGAVHENSSKKTSADIGLVESGRNLATPASLKEKTAPSAKKATAVSPVASNPSKKALTSGSGYGTYSVQKGDTLNKIARQFNTTPDILSKLNLIKDPNSLKMGMAIKVPQK